MDPCNKPMTEMLNLNIENSKENEENDEQNIKDDYSD